MIEVQLQAARLVLDVLGGRSLSAALPQAKARRRDLSVPQWGAVQDISYGVFRHLGLLRGVLAELLAKPLTDRDIEALVLVALYQLELTDAAPHAVVNDAVEACARLHKTSVKGLVNAVLRGFLRQREELVDKARLNDEGRWSYPRWWIEAVRSAYPDRYAAVLEAGNARPPMTLRVNLRRTSRKEYLARLQTHGLDAQPVGEAGLIMDRPVPIDKLPGFAEGLVSVQDLAAQYAAPLLDAKPGQRVLDACAAPGGKGAHLLERTDIQLTAIDNVAPRLVLMQDTLDRLRLAAQLVCADAADILQWWNSEPFDRILLDAPCTASGITRRHPDIRWLRRPEDITNLAAQQAHLLQAVWQTLAAGGKLLYVTCSVFPAENHLQLSAFLQAHPDARWLEPSGIPQGPEIGNLNGQILPDSLHDGFFYALLYKV